MFAVKKMSRLYISLPGSLCYIQGYNVANTDYVISKISISGGKSLEKREMNIPAIGCAILTYIRKVALRYNLY